MLLEGREDLCGTERLNVKHDHDHVDVTKMHVEWTIVKYTFFVPHAFAMESKQSERDTKRGGRERRSEKAMSKPGRERQWTNVRVKKYERDRRNTPGIETWTNVSVKKYKRQRRNTAGIETHPSMKESKQSERDTKRGRQERRRGEKRERHEEGR